MNSVNEEKSKIELTEEYLDYLYKKYKRNLRFKSFRRLLYFIAFYFIPSVIIGHFLGLKCEIVFIIGFLLPTLFEFIEFLINKFTRYRYE